MKMVLMILAGVLLIGGGVVLFNMRGALATGVQTPEESSAGTLWTQQTHTLEGEATSLEPWQGQVVLVVNVASKCGLTPQYEGLEALYQELKDEGFAVLAFPSNDFMGQEPGTAEEIRTFCDSNYQISFPLFEKMPVKGDGKSELYQFLTAGGLEEPTWNFTKYLVGRDGKVAARFAPRTTPDDAQLRAAIATALGD
jgi:glutathione peroxidase